MSDETPQKNPFAAPQSPWPSVDPGAEEASGNEPRNPLLTIWTRPRATMRSIYRTDPSQGVLALSAFAGVGEVLQNERLSGVVFERYPLHFALGVIVVAGSLGGILFINLFGMLCAWVGRQLGGRGTRERCRAAIAWSSVPMIPATALALMLLIAIGMEFVENPDNGLANPVFGHVVALNTWIAMVLGIWSTIAWVKCTAEAHQFSSWRAACTLFLALIALVPLVLLIVSWR